MEGNLDLFPLLCRLRIAARKPEVKQKYLAAICGVSEVTLCHMLYGRKKIPKDIQAKLIEELNLEPLLVACKRRLKEGEL